MDIIAGSYEHLVFGYKLAPNEENKLKITASFSSDSHSGPVGCMAISSKGLVASGSKDESIRLIRLAGKRVEIGVLTHHTGSITDLMFHKRTHLLSCSEDGMVVVWRVGSWDLLKELPHNSPINSSSIHPSGSLMVSVCKDRTLQTWNLIRGKKAFVINLKTAGEIVRFNKDGGMFGVVCGRNVCLYSTKTGTVSHTYKLSFFISCLLFSKQHKNIMLVGGDGGGVEFLSTCTHQSIYLLHTNTSRVKDISLNHHDTHLTIVSSDGFIKVYDVVVDGEGKDIKIRTAFETGVVTSHRWLSMKTYDEEEEEDDDDGGEEEEEDDDGGEEDKNDDEMEDESSEDEEDEEEDMEKDDDDDSGGDQEDVENEEVDLKDGDEDEEDEDDGKESGSNDGEAIAEMKKNMMKRKWGNKEKTSKKMKMEKKNWVPWNQFKKKGDGGGGGSRGDDGGGGGSKKKFRGEKNKNYDFKKKRFQDEKDNTKRLLKKGSKFEKKTHAEKNILQKKSFLKKRKTFKNNKK